MFNNLSVSLWHFFQNVYDLISVNHHWIIKMSSKSNEKIIGNVSPSCSLYNVDIVFIISIWLVIFGTPIIQALTEKFLQNKS